MKTLSHSLHLMALVAGFLISIASVQAESSSADAVTWMTDFEAAKAKAESESKAMLVDFTGSDWCGWCIKLDEEVFSKEAFKEYAVENLVLVEIDFPRSKEQSDELKAQNEALAKKYGIRGFPTILLLDAGGDVIARTGYKRGGAAKYVEHLKSLLAE